MVWDEPRGQQCQGQQCQGRQRQVRQRQGRQRQGGDTSAVTFPNGMAERRTAATPVELPNLTTVDLSIPRSPNTSTFHLLLRHFAHHSTPPVQVFGPIFRWRIRWRSLGLQNPSQVPLSPSPLPWRGRRVWTSLTIITAVVLGAWAPGTEAASHYPSGASFKFPQVSAFCETEPEAYLAQMLNSPQLRRSHWGILIQPLSAAPQNAADTVPEPWLSHNANQFFNPASNAKLLTTAAILTRLGSHQAVATSLYLEPSSDSRPPNLWLHTLGDPTLDGDVLTQFAATTAQAGVTAIDTLWLQAADFGLAQRGRISSWEWGDLPFYYGAPVSTAILNQNRMVLTITGTRVGQLAQVSFSDAIAADQWQINNKVITSAPDIPARVTLTPGWPNTLHLTGTIPPNTTDLTTLAIPQPALYLGNSLKLALEQRGVTVNQIRISRDANPHANPNSNLVSLALHASPQSDALVHITNQISNNLYAETLLGWLGLALESTARSDRSDRSDSSDRPDSSDQFDLGTPAGRSRYALTSTLTELGLSPDQYRIADGSGLSRQNLVTPQALVALLDAMWRSPETATFRRSLPIAGQTGTLQRRFKGTILEGKLIAKTGTLTGVSALSGYFPHGDRWVAFSILVNHSNQPASVLRQAMDDLLVAIAETPSHCLSPQSMEHR